MVSTILPKSKIISGYQGSLNPGSPATILNGQTISSILNCGGFALCGIFIPASFEGTALTFQGSVDGVNFFPVHSTTTGSALSYTVAASTYAAIDPKDFQGLNYLKIVSGTVTGADRALACALKGF